VFSWALAAGMTLLVWVWGRHNRRAGYQRPPRRALLEEGFRLLRPFEEPELPERAAAATLAKETPVAQLVSLSLAVQSATPRQVEESEPIEKEIADSEVIHSPT
jgi:hypothetical protein